MVAAPPINTVWTGDCTQLLPSLPDRCIDFIFTDPPYGLNYGDGDLVASIRTDSPWDDRTTRERPPVANDGPEDADRVFKLFVIEARRLLVPGGCLCYCGSWGTRFAQRQLWASAQLDEKAVVPWIKPFIGMGQHYRSCYENVYVFQRPGAACRWFDTTKAVKNYVDHIRGMVQRDELDHPTSKPSQLASHFIQLHTRHGDTVLDPFCGAGSTLVAAKALGRRYIGIEVSPHWADRARQVLRQDPLPFDS